MLVYLKLVTYVDHNGVFHWWDIDPFSFFEQLESADLVVLEEEDDATGVGVGSETLDKLWPRTRRVVADLGAKGWTLGAIESLLQVPFL